MWWYNLAITNSLIQCRDQLFTKYVGSPLDRGGYLDIERAGTGGRSRKGDEGRGRGVRFGVLDTKCLVCVEV
jgi:hypothetical protein